MAWNDIPKSDISDKKFVFKGIRVKRLECGYNDNYVSQIGQASVASVEHHGVQPTGCMDNEPEPSRGVPC